MSSESDLVVAIDWGGTWIRAATVDANGQVRWRDRIPNPKDASQSQLLAAGRAMLDRAIAQCGGAPLGAGIAVAGPVDGESGKLHGSPHLPQLNGISLKSLWESDLDCPVFTGNDANLAALGEFHHGAGGDARKRGSTSETLVYLTISTGIGGGVVDRGKVFLGAGGLAAEIGHMAIDTSDSAPLCLCGGRGCLEALASGTAIARIAQEKLAMPGAGSSALAETDSQAITSEAVFQAAGAGDTVAWDIVQGAVNALAVGLTNVLHLYNPDLVILGGGASVGLADLGLIDKIRALMDRRAMSPRHKDFTLAASSLGDSAGIIGAATMVRQESG